MLPQNKPDRIRILFDDHRLVANAGLLLPATLARHLGLRERGYVNRCVNDIRRRPSQPLIQWRFHPHTVHRGRRLRSTQGPSDA